MERRFTVDPKTDSPEDVRAAEMAQRVLDAMPDDLYMAMVKKASGLAAQDLVYGRPIDQAAMETALAEFGREYLQQH